MSVYLVTGVPGAGKSHETVRRFLIPAFEAGRKVITNIGLNIEEIEKKYPLMKDLIVIKRGESLNNNPQDIYTSTFDKLEDYTDEWRNEKGQAALYVIDEAHFVFGTNNCSKDKIVNMTNFITMHRKYGIDIVVITQVSDMLNRTILKLMESCYACDKLDYLGAKNSYRVGFYLKYNDRKPQEIQTFSYDKKVYDLYSSYEGNVVEETQLRKPSFFQLLKMYWFLPVLGLLILTIASYFIFKGDSGKISIQSNKVENISVVNSKPILLPSKIKKDNISEVVPLWDYDIKIKSWYQNNISSFSVEDGLFTFSIIEDGEEIFYLNSLEMKSMGYSVITFKNNFCLVILKFKEKSRYSVCEKKEKELYKDLNVPEVEPF